MYNKKQNHCIYILIIKIIGILKNIYIFSVFVKYNIKMTLNNIDLTRKEYNLIVKNRSIEEPQNMSTEELLNTLSRYDSRRKVKSNYQK